MGLEVRGGEPEDACLPCAVADHARDRSLALSSSPVCLAASGIFADLAGSAMLPLIGM